MPSPLSLQHLQCNQYYDTRKRQKQLDEDNNYDPNSIGGDVSYIVS